LYYLCFKKQYPIKKKEYLKNENVVDMLNESKMDYANIKNTRKFLEIPSFIFSNPDFKQTMEDRGLVKVEVVGKMEELEKVEKRKVEKVKGKVKVKVW
jgi:hypothetical protein